MSRHCHRSELEGLLLVTIVFLPSVLHFAQGDKRAGWTVVAAIVLLFFGWLLQIVPSWLFASAWLAAFALPARHFEDDPDDANET